MAVDVQKFTIDALLKVGGHEFVEVLQMHELGVDFVHHGLVEFLLEDALVLLAHAHEGWVDCFERGSAWNFENAAIFS